MDSDNQKILWAVIGVIVLILLFRWSRSSGFMIGAVQSAPPQQAYRYITGAPTAEYTLYNYGPDQSPPSLNSYVDAPGSSSMGFTARPSRSKVRKSASTKSKYRLPAGTYSAVGLKSNVHGRHDWKKISADDGRGLPVPSALAT